ncbi:TonB-dependent receptor [Pararhodonellum marinum]|uniref:TonB-dependent receptor n=1 Tax=Pararhodonellum marinum TaxID=2755358 RepID=UPI001E4DEF32|nr:TonB-dependent receptor plug domain-containing protein [Pararhodonellum marinum]
MPLLYVMLLGGLSFGNGFLPFDRDTVDLQPVEVYSPALDKFTHGQTIRRLDRRDLAEFQGRSLGDLLQERSGLFVRQYGAGMLASITMRGTSAGHTALFWNGLPINSPSLGQADLSILPMEGFDEATVHFGSTGALYGTDAIGGAIHLNKRLRFSQGHQVNLQQALGSFGRHNTRMGHAYSNGRFSSRTGIYHNFAQNNFPFINQAKIDTPTERQNHARVAQWGATQDLAWQIAGKSQLSTSIWWNHTDREIQPVMGSNTSDQQQDGNLRWVADYHHFGQLFSWNAKTGLIRDELIFNEASRNLVTQYFMGGEAEGKFGEAWETKSGVRFTLIEGKLSTYAAWENRLELYQSVNFRPGERWGLSLNLRQLVYEGNWAPFTPAISGTYALLQTESHQLDLQSAFSRSFKVPTLNDRFWVPGGIPDLESEKSLSGELGLKHLWTKSDFQWETQVTYFQMKVDNWIIWLPNGSFWSPSNIREVHNSGVESFVKGSKSLGKWQIEAQADYAWNRAINRTNVTENDRSQGKQLPYTPEHKFQVTGRLGRGSLSTYVNTHWVGERFIATDNVSKLSAYQLWNWGGTYAWTAFGKMKGDLGLQINNLFNTDYQVLRLRAMPGRNYQINLTINL